MADRQALFINPVAGLVHGRTESIDHESVMKTGGQTNVARM
jgi:hypothetical protein